VNPWVFVAALVIYIVVSKWKASPVEPEPLVPSILSAPIPPAPASRPAETQRTTEARTGGVNPLLLAAVMVPWGLLAWSHLGVSPETKPDRPPAPAPDGWPSLDLRGAFVGETAAEDALTTQYLSDSLAGWVAYDGTLKEPRLKTGSAFADIRRIAREGRMEGQTLGGRQPIAKERIKVFLDAAVGDFGGPADPPLRAKFVRAMNDITAAAAAAVGRKP
jgi:hypothetical protein